MYYIGIDLGGTNFAVGICNENYEIIARGEGKTNVPRPCEELCADMAGMIRKVVADAGLSMDEIQWIGIGSPGAIDAKSGEIVYANNLGYIHAPMGSELNRLTGKDVYMENDANAAAYGEAVAGAAKGTQTSVTVTLGTGVGGGIIIDGKVFSGWNSFGAELGHMVIVKDGRRCTCGRKGCWEAYASVSGLIYQTKLAMIDHADSAMWEIVGGDIKQVNGRTAFDAMRSGDPVAKAVCDKYIEYIACGAANVVNIFQPEVLVFGGGISKEGETLLGPMRPLIREFDYARFGGRQTKIVAAELGRDAGIIGAAFLGRSMQ